MPFPENKITLSNTVGRDYLLYSILYISLTKFEMKNKFLISNIKIVSI